MRCSTLVLSVAALVVGSATAFAPARTAARSSRAHVLRMGASDEHDAAPSLVGAADRRGVLRAAALAGGALITEGVWGVPTAHAAEIKKVVVAGATGQTGRRVLERLGARGGLAVVGGVRDVAKATKALAESSTTVRGAMVQQVGAVSTAGISLSHLDVVADSAADLSATLSGADALVIATGFVPGNPFKMQAAAHAVDNVGTIALVDAAKAAGVKKVVMVSSILTNGRAWGQENSPGFQVTNAFGGVLDEKIVAEKYLRASGLDYTIVRPGGLKATPPTGELVVAKEDTLNAGEVSRDLVADVVVAALFDGKGSNKVVEIVEGDVPKLPLDKWFA